MAFPQNWKTGREPLQNPVLTEFLLHHDPCRGRGCWRWPKYKNAKGYGVIMFNGIKFPVHQVSFKYYKGIIPQGMVVMHECDNPACFNPDHLFLGTNAENMQDMVRKGRHGSQRKPSLRSSITSLAQSKDLNIAIGLPPARKTPRGVSDVRVRHETAEGEKVI